MLQTASLLMAFFKGGDRKLVGNNMIPGGNTELNVTFQGNRDDGSLDSENNCIIFQFGECTVTYLRIYFMF